MKDKIEELKELIKKYNSLYNEFENRKKLFNLRVEDLCEEYDCTLYPIGLDEQEINEFDYYNKAKRFFKDNEVMVRALNNIRKNNVGAERKKLNSLYIKYLINEYGYDYTIAYFYVINYSVYVEAGYYKTVGCETVLSNNLRRISNQTEALKKQGIDMFDGFVSDAKNKLRPYAVKAVDKVKPFVHQGSKTLAKVFTKIADKTQKKNDYRLI